MDPRRQYVPQVFAAALLVVLPCVLHRPAEPRGITNGEQICVAEQGALLRAGACPGVREPFWFADASIRRAAGAPICWWHADAERFSDVSGVGPAMAPRVAAHRDAGGTLENLEDIRGVGPSLSAKIRRDATTRCALVPIPSDR